MTARWPQDWGRISAPFECSGVHVALQSAIARRAQAHGSKDCMIDKETVTVSIWPLAVSPGRLAALHAVLSRDEQDRVGKMKHEQTAREFVVSRGMAREVLASACGCASTDIVLANAPRGKPHLVDPPSPLTFNLSHSGGYCALAIGAVPAIGVDIEVLRDTVGEFAKNVFSEREALAYAAYPPAERMGVFFRAWVAKEAYLKATGHGLAGGLKSLEIDLTAAPDIRPLAIGGNADTLTAWQFHGFDVTDTVAGAVAISTGGRPVDIRVDHIGVE